jgi:HEAT repeat protein
MNAVRFCAVALVAVWTCGCGGSSPPTLAGGKPVSHWVGELKNPDPKHRREAVEKLGNVGLADPEAFPAVCAAFQDADPRVRCAAVLAVLKFGETAREAVPLLEDLRKRDRDPRVREFANRALERLRSAA